MARVMLKLKVVKSSLKAWNLKCFGDLHKRIVDAQPKKSFLCLLFLRPCLVRN